MVQFPGFVDVEYLAEGGLGRVFKATRESTGGVVAIKEIKQIAVGSASWRRARREVEALVRLKGHPHVVNVEEIITSADGNPALVMEFLDAGSAGDLIDAGPVPLDQAMRIGAAILSAIDASHAHGIIHRDLKPPNVLLGTFGQIKVCDFGIAGIARDDGHTQTSAATLAYASPEQIEDATIVGPPADVYSFAVTFLHIVNGTRPSFADRLNGNVTLPAALADAHPPLIALLAQAMATVPDDRPTVAEIHTALMYAARQLDITAGTPISSGSAAAVAGAAASSTPRPLAPPPASGAPVPVVEPTVITGEPPAAAPATGPTPPPGGPSDLPPANALADARPGAAGSQPGSRSRRTLVIAAALVAVIATLVVVLPGRGDTPASNDTGSGTEQDAGDNEQSDGPDDNPDSETGEHPDDPDNPEELEELDDQDGPTGDPEATPLPPVTGVGIAAETTVGTSAFTATSADGHLWVPHEGGVTVLEPDGLATVATVAFEGSAETPLEYERRIWVPNIGVPALTVIHVDDPGTVLATVPVGNRATTPVASNGYVWVPNRDDGTVTRIDPTTYDVLTIAIADALGGVRATDDGVEALVGGNAYPIAADGTVGAPAPAVREPEILRTRDWDWVVTDTGVERLDPDSGELDTAIDIELTTAVASAAGLWLAVRGDEPAVVFIDQTTLEPFRIAVDGNPDTPTVIDDHRVVVTAIPTGRVLLLAAG